MDKKRPTRIQKDFRGVTMIQEQMLLDRIETQLGEYKEELGDNFPVFMNYHLAARLIKAEQEIEFLRRVVRQKEKELVS